MSPTCNEICLLHIAKFLFIDFLKAKSSTMEYLQHCQICTTIIFLRATHSKILNPLKKKKKNWAASHSGNARG
jgi:hypothetical protein